MPVHENQFWFSPNNNFEIYASHYHVATLQKLLASHFAVDVCADALGIAIYFLSQTNHCRCRYDARQIGRYLLPSKNRANT